MAYKNLHQCLQDLESRGQLIRIDQEIDPDQEIAAIQRRVFQANGPALLFTKIKNCPFPMAGNIFGTHERLRFIFKDTLNSLEQMLRVIQDPSILFKKPLHTLKISKNLWNLKPRIVRNGPVMDHQTNISSLPQLKSWPMDGGSFITLPQVYTEDPEKPGLKHSNLGMYRIQISGNQYTLDKEVGLHYQIHRGIASHHAKAIKKNNALPVNIFVGGPPALTVAAIMPLPAGISEVFFAGALSGHRIPFLKPAESLAIPAEADFCISGEIVPGRQLPEGPFGDHLGYYSLTHNFPVISIKKVWHRKHAIWPFTTVGRPPQEDSIFSEFIHELLKPIIPFAFSGVHEVNAVSAAGVHCLLLALGSERYVPFTSKRIPQELHTNAHALLGNTQTSLSKYVFIAAKEDNPELKTNNIPDFLKHILTRVDWSKDLHFITRTTMDTLDYSGVGLNQGSKAIIAAAGENKRNLSTTIPAITWPSQFYHPHIFYPGILILQGPRHNLDRDLQDPEIEKLSLFLAKFEEFKKIPMIVIVDDTEFTVASWENFLWVTFTRSDPATDTYGLGSFYHCKHWGCKSSLIIDARLKSYHAPSLKSDPQIEKRVDQLGAPSGPLHGII